MVIRIIIHHNNFNLLKKNYLKTNFKLTQNWNIVKARIAVFMQVYLTYLGNFCRRESVFNSN